MLMVVANALLALLYLTQSGAISRGIPNAPAWIVPLFGLGALANVISAIAVWQWRKWGVYTLGAVAILFFIGNVSVVISPLSAVIGLAGPVILGILLRSRWQALT